MARDGRRIPAPAARYLAPFDLLFSAPKFEYADLVGRTGLDL